MPKGPRAGRDPANPPSTSHDLSDLCGRVAASGSGESHCLIVDRYEKYKKRRAKRRGRRILFWIIILIVIAALYGGWRLWACLHNVSPEFKFIFLTKNEAPLKLVNGEVLRLHPKDRLKILKVSTNICFNRGVRLVATGFDTNALFYEEMPLAVLLPDRDIFNQYSFRVMIKHFNQDLGHVDIVVNPI